MTVNVRKISEEVAAAGIYQGTVVAPYGSGPEDRMTFDVTERVRRRHR